MKIIYETFAEIADDFVFGDHWTHKLSKHTPDECFPWQQGVNEFADFLDKVGIKLIKNSNFEEKLWSGFGLNTQEHEVKEHKGG